ncbi:alpha-amylase family protein [Pedobacter sp. SYSU D00535]|uniref:alpha-amylase family protein n=1 Tax=Pedobacter sp. SYSU D00535 TaxID=2810308 RepID=UPI001A95FD31|nr:alpha-amylase family protein [Pedobacter sp. SYSU D00535]
MNHIWYKNAIFYSLDIETFYDANGDGIGDFQGLIQKLDYLSGLGITCIWLLPFFPSPNRDNGYDITDYYNVDPRLGTLGDFAELMDKAGQLGIRILIDLVVNHTSIDHPWFQEAVENPQSGYFNYYIWSDDPQAHGEMEPMLKGEVDTLWTYNEKAGKYYLHRFYREQPDLNIANPEVRSEILRVMGFWLRLGVSGFRIDAAERLIETYGMDNPGEYQLSCFFEEMREFISLRKSDAILLAETNLEPENMHTYFQKGERMHMAFNFFINQHLFLALAEEDASHLGRAYEREPGLFPQNQWLNFLRHHDELSLQLLNEQQRQSIYRRFAPDKNMLVFESGIRRRIAPMLKADRKHMELAYSLLFSLPGTPMVRYGDEIGMGENLELKGRASVRTPMQWSEAPEAGFSVSHTNKNVPVIDDEAFGFQAVNVRKQQQDASSFLSWVERLIIARKQFPEIGYGARAVIETAQRGLFLQRFQHQEGLAYLFHNLSSRELIVNWSDLSIESSRLAELFGDAFSKQEDDSLILSPYGYKWYKYQNNQ